MDKRTILAIVLSAIILIGYYGFFYEPPQAPGPQVENAPSAPATTASTFPSESPGDSPESGEPQPQSPPEIEQLPIQTQEIKTTQVLAEFINRGGLPFKWALEEFYEKADNQGGHIDLLRGTESNPAMGLLLFPGKSAFYPSYKVDQSDQDSIQYSSQVGELDLVQNVKVGDPPYSVEVLLKIKNLSDRPIDIAPGLRMSVPQVPGAEDKKGGFFSQSSGSPLITPLYRIDTSVERENKYEDLGAYQEMVGQISWVGLEDQYFLRAIVARSVSNQNRTVFGKKGNVVYSDFQYPTQSLGPHAQREVQLTVYLGPKDPTYLKPFSGADLEAAIDFGIFGFLARPLLWLMKFFESFLGNWGLAIILLTVLIKVALLPLTKKSMSSMKGMQEIQPQLKNLREKYKDDREKLNAETIALFRRHKVNPAGGCLPMLLQMPIYIALYKVLYNATELYHAPFFAFYRDLSAPDPYYILPILAGLAMLAQQKMTPSTGDPTQAKMMLIMPIMFGVFMIFLPLGLVLYIFVNTVMTGAQQIMHQRDISILGMIRGKGST